MTHASPWRCGLSSDERNNWQATSVVLLKPFSSLFLGFTTNLTNHNNAFGLGVNHKAFQHINKVSAVKRVATNADYRGLAKLLCCCLVDSLVS